MEEKSIREILSINVKFYRFSMNITQEELAENCDLSSRYVSDIENVKGNITIDTVEKIANYLNVKPYLLLKEQRHKKLPKRVNMQYYKEKNK